MAVEESCFDGVVCFETMNPHLFVQPNEDDDVDLTNFMEINCN
jgi:hypothetical protein